MPDSHATYYLHLTYRPSDLAHFSLAFFRRAPVYTTTVRRLVLYAYCALYSLLCITL